MTRDATTQPAHADLPDLLDEGLALFATQVRAVTDADWDRPTPCSGWSVRDLVGHVVGTMTAGAAILEGRPAQDAPARPGDVVAGQGPHEVAERVEELARGFRAALAGADLDESRETPMGRRSMAEGLAFPIVDLAVHSWDLGHALGRPVELPAPLLAYADSFSRSVPADVTRRPGVFGPEVEPPADASPTERLMAFLGRPLDPAIRTSPDPTPDSTPDSTTKENR